MSITKKKKTNTNNTIILESVSENRDRGILKFKEQFKSKIQFSVPTLYYPKV